MENFLSGREQLGDQRKHSGAKDRDRSGADDQWDVSENSDDAEMHETEGQGGSRVSYVKEEGRVTKIIVTCACGQVTEIDCDYEG